MLRAEICGAVRLYICLKLTFEISPTVPCWVCRWCCSHAASSAGTQNKELQEKQPQAVFLRAHLWYSPPYLKNIRIAALSGRPPAAAVEASVSCVVSRLPPSSFVVSLASRRIPLMMAHSLSTSLFPETHSPKQKSQPPKGTA